MADYFDPLEDIIEVIFTLMFLFFKNYSLTCGSN